MSNTRDDTSEDVALTDVEEPEFRELNPIEPEAIYPVDPNVIKPDPNAEVVVEDEE